MRYTLLIILIALATTNCSNTKKMLKGEQQKTAVISGTVYDGSNGQALPGTSITIADKGIAATDGNGKYKVTVNRRDKLTFSFIGFLPQTVDLKVLAHDTVNIFLIEYKMPSQPEIVIRGR